MKDMERMHRLLKMAEQDANYMIWKKTCEECGEKITRFAKWCPKKVRSIFYAYIDCERMMNQRLMNIACTNMEFIEESPK